MSNFKWMAATCFAAALALLGLGCAGSAGPAPAFDAVTGQHPSGWIQVHYAGYVQNPDQCRSCHGSTPDPSQAGGISGVSCFKCHASGVIIHPATGWADPMQHGRNGAQLGPVTTASPAVPVMAGFAHCAKCHGADYTGGLAGVSCYKCHSTAPHPAKPWWSNTLQKPIHVETNIDNAPECAKCHYPGSANNPVGWPVTPAPAGTAPGCFNNTLCHGTSVPATGVIALPVLHP